MKRFISFMMYVYQHFMKTNCFTRAASLSFTTILALVPLMLVAAYVFSFFSVSAVFQQKIQTFIFSNFVASSGSTIAFYLNSFLMRTHILSTLSSIFLVFTAFSILFSIEESLNVIWEIPFNRKWYLAILFNLFILIIAPLFIMLSLGISYWLNYLPTHKFSVLVLSCFPILFSYWGYLIIYKIMPNQSIPWKSAMLMAAVAALLFELAKVLFAFYIKLFPTYQIIYGAISAIPILLIWVYICWMIFLFAAVVGYCQKI